MFLTFLTFLCSVLVSVEILGGQTDPRSCISAEFFLQGCKDDVS